LFSVDQGNPCANTAKKLVAASRKSLPEQALKTFYPPDQRPELPIPASSQTATCTESGQRQAFCTLSMQVSGQTKRINPKKVLFKANHKLLQSSA